jgi:outer membrane protein TolC
MFTLRNLAVCTLALSFAAAPLLAASPEKNVITLEDAYARTLATDQSVRIAYLEIRKANLLPWSALAKFGPRINGTFNYSHTETNNHGDFLNAASLTTAGSQTAGLKLNQPLIDFTFFPAYRNGKLTVLSTRLQYQLTIRTVLFGVAKAYYEVLKQKKIVALDKDTLGLAQGQLELSQNQYDAGTVSRVDVLRAQSTLESARQTLISDTNILALDRDTLANTLNLPQDARDFEAAQPDDADDKIAVPFSQHLAEAYANREDYKVSAIAIKQSVEQKNLVLAQYAPSVSAQFGKNLTSSNGSPQSDAWDALVSVEVPIFSGGQREVDLLTAQHNIKESEISFETAKKNVESDVETTWLQTETLRETIKSLKAQVDANEQNYEDLKNQYEAGTATSLDTQTALIQLANSRTTLITQTYQYQVALRDLERAKGDFQNKRIKGVRLP